jgi:hypothetical protein
MLWMLSAGTGSPAWRAVAGPVPAWPTAPDQSHELQLRGRSSCSTPGQREVAIGSISNLQDHHQQQQQQQQEQHRLHLPQAALRAEGLAAFRTAAAATDTATPTDVTSMNSMAKYSPAAPPQPQLPQLTAVAKQFDDAEHHQPVGCYRGAHDDSKTRGVSECAARPADASPYQQSLAASGQVVPTPALPPPHAAAEAARPADDDDCCAATRSGGVAAAAAAACGGVAAATAVGSSQDKYALVGSDQHDQLGSGHHHNSCEPPCAVKVKEEKVLQGGGAPDAAGVCGGGCAAAAPAAAAAAAAASPGGAAGAAAVWRPGCLTSCDTKLHPKQQQQQQYTCTQQQQQQQQQQQSRRLLPLGPGKPQVRSLPPGGRVNNPPHVAAGAGAAPDSAADSRLLLVERLQAECLQLRRTAALALRKWQVSASLTIYITCSQPGLSTMCPRDGTTHTHICTPLPAWGQQCGWCYVIRNTPYRVLRVTHACSDISRALPDDCACVLPATAGGRARVVHAIIVCTPGHSTGSRCRRCARGCGRGDRRWHGACCAQRPSRAAQCTAGLHGAHAGNGHCCGGHRGGGTCSTSNADSSPSQSRATAAAAAAPASVARKLPPPSRSRPQPWTGLPWRWRQQREPQG